MATGKHARQSDFNGCGILVVVIAILIFVQALMCNETIRAKLSIVDFYEGQRIGLDKK